MEAFQHLSVKQEELSLVERLALEIEVTRGTSDRVGEAHIKALQARPGHTMRPAASLADILGSTPNFRP